MQNKLRVSIGIPAFNEERNIRKLLASLLSQEKNNYQLIEILVVNDGSTDGTSTEARGVTNPVVSVLSNNRRTGLPACENLLMRKYTGDVLILLNADVEIQDPSFVDKMLQPIISDPSVGIVGANVAPLEPRTLFEQVINYSVEVKQDIYRQINDGDNIYLCHGRGRALSRKLTGQLEFLAYPGEDAYSYIICKQKGLRFIFQESAILFYRSPQNLNDHLRQSKRFIQARSFWSNFFSKSNTDYYYIPTILYIRMGVKYFVRHPIFFSLYVAIYVYARVLSVFSRPITALWDVSVTSKALR